MLIYLWLVLKTTANGDIFLAVVCFIGGRYAILNYLDKVSALDALSCAEEHKYSYCDSASRLFLSPSDDE